MVATVLLYPVFSITLGGLILAGVRERTLGSKWIAWVGLAGLLAHGLAPILVVALRIQQAAALFPLLILFGLWAALAAVWPSQAPVLAADEDLATT